MKKNRTPAQLLCKAIADKTELFCGNRPDLFMFVPYGILQYDISPYYLDIDLKPKIYIELRTGHIGAFHEKLYNRVIFFINIGYTTDHTNIVREDFYVHESKMRNEYHIFNNIQVSLSQSSNFIKEFLTYLHFGVVSLKTISNTSNITSASVLSQPDEADFWRWVALARI